MEGLVLRNAGYMQYPESLGKAASTKTKKKIEADEYGVGMHYS